MMRACCLAFVIAASACGPSVGTGQDGGGDDDAGPCAEGQRQCSGLDWQVCQGGEFVSGEQCPDACDDTYGCVVCVPNSGTCNGETSRMCRPDGSGWVDVFCDPLQGLACNVDTGLCDGVCAPQNLQESYIGCEYHPTITGNMVSSAYEFAVAVSNTAGEPATVTIDGGALSAPVSFSVPSNSVVVRKLPWQTALKLCAGATWIDCLSPTVHSAQVADGAYHLRSTLPVTVYQFNPLDYTLPSAPENSYTNDASLLFPVNVWRDRYYVTAWPAFSAHASILAVTAYQDATQVTITTKADTQGGGGAPAFVANVPQTVTLNSGDVLEIGASVDGADLTGSLVTADKGVQVIGAHYCANVPDTSFGYCDHLEESMFPVQALSTRYIVHAPAVTTLPQGKENVVKIIATEANTTLIYDPPQASGPATLANPGDVAVIAREVASYMISADHKIIVVQYMEGSTAGGGTGDPAMALAVPVDQYRTQYLFHAPTNYETNYVDITAPTGASVTLDGAPVTSWTPVGSTGYSLARITPLGPGPSSDGNHNITGNMPFGITVYGYGQDTSYWYPGGLDLVNIPVP